MKNLSVIFLLLTLLAEIVGTVGGFGSSVFFVPIANFYFSFQAALGLTALLHLSSNISKIVLFKKGLNKRLLLLLGIPSVVFVFVGGWMSNYFNSTYFGLILGTFLAVTSIILFAKPTIVIKPGKQAAILGGSLSGFAAGLLGTGGAIRGVVMAAFNLEKSVYIATSAFIDFFVDFSRTFVYYFSGYIKSELLIYLPFLLGIGFIGTYLGKRLLNHIAQENFKRISLLLIFIIGLITLANSLI